MSSRIPHSGIPHSAFPQPRCPAAPRPCSPCAPSGRAYTEPYGSVFHPTSTPSSPPSPTPRAAGSSSDSGGREASITELAEQFEMTLTGMKKHVQAARGRRTGAHTEGRPRPHLHARPAPPRPTRRPGSRSTSRCWKPDSTASRNSSSGPRENSHDHAQRSNHAQAHAHHADATAQIRIERIFDATRDRVWRAYTEPELLAQWWGRGNKLVIERMRWSAADTGALSSTHPTASHGFEGRFREVTPQDRIVRPSSGTACRATRFRTRRFDGPGRRAHADREHVALLHARRARRNAHLGMEGGMAQSYRGAGPVAWRMGVIGDEAVRACESTDYGPRCRFSDPRSTPGNEACGRGELRIVARRVHHDRSRTMIDTAYRIARHALFTLTLTTMSAASIAAQNPGGPWGAAAGCRSGEVRDVTAYISTTRSTARGGRSCCCTAGSEREACSARTSRRWRRITR